MIDGLFRPFYCYLVARVSPLFCQVSVAMDRYALVIGISQYEGMDDLSKPQGDAIALQQVLEKADWRVTCLSDRVTFNDLETALKTFLERQAAGQDALIYFTGHGFMVEPNEDDRQGYLATSDCQVKFAEATIVAQESGLSFKRLNGLIQRAQLSSLVVLLDCCHGGLLVEDGLVKQSFKAEPDQNFCWIAACRSFQQSYARRSASHSLFTGALLQSLAQAQAAGDVTVLSVLRDVNAAFKQMALQEPIYIGAGKDIPLISYRQEAIAPTFSPENPYQGLRFFTAATQQFFFGRETEIQTLAQKVQNCGFVPLIGASGSGKSSVVRAGLMPRLEQLGWRVLAPIVPGTDPIAALRSATADLYIGDVLTPDVAGAWPRISGDDKILLVVDQFEEVFTLCRKPDERSQFIRSLLEFSAQAQGRMAVVVTMRADFIEAGLTDQGLTRAIQADAVWLGAMARENLELAIEQPAKTQGATFQPKLLAQILQDVESEENCLPLLEFALAQLWDRKTGQELTLDIYRKLDGVTGALNAHAEAVYKQLANQQREQWVQRLMLRLVRTGEGTRDTRQRQRKADLLAMAKDTVEREAVAAVLQTLVDSRLLVSDRVENHDVIDLSHEALMLSWQRFVGWRESDREVRRIVDKIEDEQRAWQDNGKKRRYLLDGRLLKDAQRLLKEKSAAVMGSKAFIQQSLGWRRIQMAGVILIPVLVIGVPAENYWREAAVKRDYELIERLGSGEQGERAAVLNLVGGCWARNQFTEVLGYFRERIFGNCRSLGNAKLDNANLYFANLRRVDLQGADLSRAELSHANLSGANLMSANLSNAALWGANLSGVDLGETSLSGAILIRVNLSGATLADTNLSDARLGEANLSRATLALTNLSRADLGRANLQEVRFKCTKYLSISEKGKELRRLCSNLKDIKWDKYTNWQGIQGWETVENIPPALQQQLGLKKANEKREDERGERIVRRRSGMGR